MITASPIARPVLRYHGGKFRIAPWVLSHFPPHRIYVEPYGGAASILMRKPPACYSEVYNDLDSNVVNVFRILRDPIQAAELERVIRLTPFAREELTGAYIPTDDPIESARRLIVRSFMGFGSDSVTRRVVTGFRKDANRSGTTPAHDWVNWPSHIQLFTKRLVGVIIENRDALLVMLDHDKPDTLHYVDPPYVHSTRSRTTSKYGYVYEMNDEEHVALAEHLHSLSGMVVLSGYRTDWYDELYRDWTRVDRNVRADRNRPRTESLWLSPATVDRLHQLHIPFQA